MATVPPVPPGQYAPFATVTPDDHRAWIIVAAALGVSFTLVTLLVRLLIRKYVNVGWRADDTVLAATTVLSFVQASLVLGACADGLGKSINLIPAHKQIRVQQLYYASNIFYLLTSDLSKVSTALFLRRLMSPGSRLVQYTTGLLMVIPVSTFAFILATTLQCDLSHPWILVHQQCPDWFLRWEIQGAVSCLIEVAIFAAPVGLIWKLQRGLDVKVEILTPFVLRVFVIVFTGLRLGSFNRAALSSNPFLREAPYISWTQAELSWSIIAATIPTARQAVLNLITYYNGGHFGGSTQTGTQGGTSSFQMKSLKSSKKQKSESAYAPGTQQDRAADDSSSQEMIIRKDVTFDVDHAARKD